MESRLPPQNIEAEKSVLGSLMLEPEAWDEIADIISENEFYKPAHRIVFAVIRELHKRSMPTDLITISNQLMANQQLDLVGGPSYLAEILEFSPTMVNIKSHAKIIKEKAILRQVISIGQSFAEKAYSTDYVDVETFLNEFEASAFKIAEIKANQDLVDASQLVKLSLEKLELLYANKGDVTGMPSGFIDLDKMTAGFQPKEMCIIAARPSMGKTAFSLNIALTAALREKKSVAYFSVEMAKEQVMMRMLASEAKVSLSQLRTASMDESAWPRLINSAAKLSESRMFIDDTSGISPYEVHAKCRRLKAKHGLDLIIIDYLQLMSLKQRVESREREVSEISKTLKAIAKDMEVPVLALAQLNRGVEGRSDRRPMLSDLRESGSIEQDADVIMMLYRDDYYERDNPEHRGNAEVIIGKQRNGPTGTVKLRWQPEYGLFTNNIEGNAGPLPPMPTNPNGGGAGRVTPFNPPSGGKPKNFAPSF
jgi:replicative DNA helicase